MQKIAWKQTQPDPDQPRKTFPEHEIRALAENMKQHGQLVPVIVYVVGCFMLLADGERRYRAAEMAQIEELDAIVLPKKPTPAELAIIWASLDVHRASFNPMERSDLLAKTKEENKCGVGDLAKLLSMQQPYVSKLLNLQKLIPQAKEMVAARKLDIDRANALCQLSPERQEEMLVTVNTMSRDQVRAKVKAKPDEPKERRALFALASGVSVTVQGCELSLTEAIESLAETLKALKRGLGEGWDITTAQRVMRDKAKVN